MQIPCPHCGKPINPAALLAHLSAGKHKTYSEEERRRRREWCAEMRKRKADRR